MRLVPLFAVLLAVVALGSAAAPKKLVVVEHAVTDTARHWVPNADSIGTRILFKIVGFGICWISSEERLQLSFYST